MAKEDRYIDVGYGFWVTAIVITAIGLIGIVVFGTIMGMLYTGTIWENLPAKFSLYAKVQELSWLQIFMPLITGGGTIVVSIPFWVLGCVL